MFSARLSVRDFPIFLHGILAHRRRFPLVRNTHAICFIRAEVTFTRYCFPRRFFSPPPPGTETCETIDEPCCFISRPFFYFVVLRVSLLLTRKTCNQFLRTRRRYPPHSQLRRSRNQFSNRDFEKYPSTTYLSSTSNNTTLQNITVRTPPPISGDTSFSFETKMRSSILRTIFLYVYFPILPISLRTTRVVGKRISTRFSLFETNILSNDKIRYFPFRF